MFVVHSRLGSVESESEVILARAERARTFKTSFPNQCDFRLRNFVRTFVGHSIIDGYFLLISHVI